MFAGFFLHFTIPEDGGSTFLKNCSEPTGLYVVTSKKSHCYDSFKSNKPEYIFCTCNLVLNCLCNASAEKHNHLITLILIMFTEPPVIHQQQFIEDHKVRVGGDVSLICTTRGSPKPDIKWLHNGRIVEKGINYVASNSLSDRSSVEENTISLQQVEITDAGKYTCLASNVAGVAEKNYRLKVIGK
jgi:hypothetical protein